MGNTTSQLKVVKQLTRKKAVSKRFYHKGEAGFTLVELLIVIILVGVIATIAAPSWLSFVNQRRVNAANDVVLGALQEAQSEAKRTKLSYSVSFRNPSGSGVPQVAVYRTKIEKDDGTTEDLNPANPNFTGWRSLGQDLGLKRGQILLGTNLEGENNAASSISYNLDPTKKITFDYMGTLPPQPTPDLNSGKGLIVMVGAPPSINSTDSVIPSTKRCVKVTTLLGSVQIGRGNECDP